VVFSLDGKKEAKQKEIIDVEEAYNLWDACQSMYGIVERIQIWQNFAHDYEFRLLFKKALDDFNDEVKLLETQLKKYLIQGPKANRAKVNTSVNSEVLLDQFLAHDFFLILQEHLEKFLRAIVSSTTNEGIRKLFLKMLSRTLNRLDRMATYLRIKGWIETPPLYKKIPENITERLDSGEAFHLWDHLTFRYDNVAKTEIFYNYVFDGDFKLLLKVGLQGPLKQQTRMLEKELERFGIPMPLHPPNVVNPPENTEIVRDEFIFKDLMSGMHGAAITHAQAVKQCSTNDRVRGIFKNLLLAEVDMLDKLLKLGKTKGWLNPAPLYQK